jgi:predicted pyridoxine 5'-phosphate oxidase superfamily flavin-nucleotide-binding protein
MSYGFLDIAVTPAVRAAQTAMGAAALWANFQGERAANRFTDNETAFIAARDSFYIASVSETGWPYLQHRGGPPGFLKQIDDRTLAFADFPGNRQYISTGNLSASNKTCLFLMDYPRRARLKIYAHAEIIPLDADPALTNLVTLPGYRAKPERIFKLRLDAFDWNCAQHITPRFTEQDIASSVRPLQERLALLESENEKLRARLATSQAGH